MLSAQWPGAWSDTIRRVVTSLVISGLVGVCACGPKGGDSVHSPSAGKPPPGTDDRPLPVAVTPVRRGDAALYLTASATLDAAHEALVVANTRGVVESLFANEGMVVEAGEQLAVLERTPLQLAVVISRTRAETARANLHRAAQLIASHAIPPDSYRATKSAYRLALADLRLREYELQSATLRATLGGVVTKRLVGVGQTLHPNTPAFEIKQVDSIHAVVHLPEREITRVKRGQPARVVIDALPQQSLVGMVSRVSSDVDPRSGTFRATVVVANADHELKPGMFCRVEIQTHVRRNSLLVPLVAVIAFRGGHSVFVVRDGVAVRRKIAAGYTSEREMEVLSGLAENELVAIDGRSALRHGVAVRISTHSAMAHTTGGLADSNGPHQPDIARGDDLSVP
ncbi:MAG: efflux RND transporter periplasmic adaptor subunit [Gammaproteobacteria bacterium]|nr:efflux RND transporter periplasmic adaptor subunit [Gammaproteobacteria bacterium]